MPKKPAPDLSLFLDIVQKLEDIRVPYVIIGGFAATIYGITRATYDIDIIVDLTEQHIQALVEAYPLPRFYADPYQMRHAIDIGSTFNIIDVERGEKADLFPLTMDARYRPAYENRVRHSVQISGMEPFTVWAARPEDVIFGKRPRRPPGKRQKVCNGNCQKHGSSNRRLPSYLHCNGKRGKARPGLLVPGRLERGRHITPVVLSDHICYDCLKNARLPLHAG